MIRPTAKSPDHASFHPHVGAPCVRRCQRGRIAQGWRILSAQRPSAFPAEGAPTYSPKLPAISLKNFGLMTHFTVRLTVESQPLRGRFWQIDWVILIDESCSFSVQGGRAAQVGLNAHDAANGRTTLL